MVLDACCTCSIATSIECRRPSSSSWQQNNSSTGLLWVEHKGEPAAAPMPTAPPTQHTAYSPLQADPPLPTNAVPATQSPTATHCHPLLHTATHCYPLPPTATHCYPLPPTAMPTTTTHCHAARCDAVCCSAPGCSVPGCFHWRASAPALQHRPPRGLTGALDSPPATAVVSARHTH